LEQFCKLTLRGLTRRLATANRITLQHLSVSNGRSILMGGYITADPIRQASRAPRGLSDRSAVSWTL